jgi:hypothetical protein
MHKERITHHHLDGTLYNPKNAEHNSKELVSRYQLECPMKFSPATIKQVCTDAGENWTDSKVE